jgi:hypothetical protein
MDVQLPYDHGELDLDKTTTYWLNYFQKKKYMRPGDSNSGFSGSNYDTCREVICNDDMW